nr:hypothetical protein [Tanacetum cinerariifolium]
MAECVELPLIDLSSSDRITTAISVRQRKNCYRMCLIKAKKFFSLPIEEKTKLGRKEDFGFAPIYSENHDHSTSSKGDSKETFHIGPLEGEESLQNQWPSKGTAATPLVITFLEIRNGEVLQKTLVYREEVELFDCAGIKFGGIFFEKIGAVDRPSGFLRLLHYPGDMAVSDEVVYGASAHSDYGLITLLATDAVPGLQATYPMLYVCREKNKHPRTWENVIHVKGAFIVNLGNMMERWTNCLFRSTLHRVMPTGKERYSVAFFMDPNSDCIVECLKSCCSESSPPRFPPIRSGDYLRERIHAAYS